MISKMRRRSRLIMFIVAVSFVLGFGVLSLGGLLDYIRQITSREPTGPRRPDELGRVGQKAISQSEFENMRNYYRYLFLENSKARSVPSQVDEQIANQAWNYLVAEKSLEEVYRKLRIELLFDEVLEILKMAPPREIVGDSAFYTEGKFDSRKYEQVLYTQRFIQTHFPSYRDFIRGSRLEMDLKSVVRVPNAQLFEDMNRDGTKFSIAFLSVEPSMFAKPPPDKDIWSYYAAHRREFDKPERRVMRYVMLSLRVGPEDTVAARSQIDDLYSSLRSEEDFLYLTDRYNDSVGLWFKVDSLDSTMRVALRGLAPGQHTEPVLTRDGWQIARFEESDGDSVRIRTITVPIEITAAAVAELRDKIDNLTERAREEDFDSLAKELGLTAMDAPPLEKGKEYQFDPDISGSVETFARRAKIGDVSQPFRNSRNDFYVFRLSAVQRGIASVMDSFEIRNKVSSKLVNRKAWPMMETKTKSVLQQLRSGRSMEEVAQGDSQVRLQTRQQVNVAGITYLGSEFAGTVYGLNPGQTSGIVKTERGLYIIRCDAREDSPMTQPSPYVLQNRVNNLQQKVREWAEKRPRVIDYRNPFGM